MSNPYYNASGAPITSSQGYSATIRAEFTAIATGFALLPALTANKAVIINAGGTAMSLTTGGLALAGDFATTGAFNTTLVQQASVSLTLPATSGTLANLASVLGTTAEITATVGAAAVTLSLPTALTFTGKTVTGGTFASPTISGTVAGAHTYSGAITMSAALTYGGVTLSNAVTGTGSMVLSASPTITGHPTIEGVTSTGATGTGALVFGTSPSFTTPSLGAATASTININGATLGTYKLAVNGTALFSGAVQCSSSVTADTGFYNGNTAGLTCTGFGNTTNYTIQGGSSSTYWAFQSSGSGGVILNAGSTSWAALSKRDLKRDLVAIDDPLATLKKIIPGVALGNYNTDAKDQRQRAFVMYEETEMFWPAAASYTSAKTVVEVDEKTGKEKTLKVPEQATVALEQYVPLLLAICDKLTDKNEALRARVAALEAKVN